MAESGAPLTVSIVLPTLDERAYIRDCLDSLLRQDYQEIVEVLVVDGGSADGTPAIAEPIDPLIRVIVSHRVAAAAMNIGIAEAKGDVICRAEAHAVYASDYIRKCVKVLVETGADNVGGPMRPVGTTSFGRAVAAATSSRFDVGSRRIHGVCERQDVDTAWPGCWRRETLEALGGFDERILPWSSEDRELSTCLRQPGGHAVVDPSIRSAYFPRQTARGLARQHYDYGQAATSMLAKQRSVASWRPLAPAALVAGAVGVALVGRGWRRIAVPVVHAVACFAASAILARDPGVAPHRVWAAFEITHWSYGFGFWRGVARSVLARLLRRRRTLS